MFCGEIAGVHPPRSTRSRGLSEDFSSLLEHEASKGDFWAGWFLFASLRNILATGLTTPYSPFTYGPPLHLGNPLILLRRFWISSHLPPPRFSRFLPTLLGSFGRPDGSDIVSAGVAARDLIPPLWFRASFLGHSTFLRSPNLLSPRSCFFVPP